MIYCIKKVRHRFYNTIFPNTDEENLQQLIQTLLSKGSDNTLLRKSLNIQHSTYYLTTIEPLLKQQQQQQQQRSIL